VPYTVKDHPKRGDLYRHVDGSLLVVDNVAHDKFIDGYSIVYMINGATYASGLIEFLQSPNLTRINVG
jgi:hypothetical protein